MTTTIGKRIKAAREAAELSQAHLGHEVGVSPQSVQQWEADEVQPRRKRIPKIAAAIKVSEMWLETGRGPMRPGPDEAQEVGLTEDAIKLARALVNLPAKKLKAALILLDIE